MANCAQGTTQVKSQSKTLTEILEDFNENKVDYLLYRFPNLNSAERGIMSAVGKMDDELVHSDGSTGVLFHPLYSRLFDTHVHSSLTKHGGKVVGIKFKNKEEVMTIEQVKEDGNFSSWFGEL